MHAASWMLAAAIVSSSFATAQMNVQLPSAGSAPVHAPAIAPGQMPAGLEDVAKVTFAATSILQGTGRVEGLPLAATGRIVIEQTLADGSTVKSSYQVAGWRDAEGKTRVEFEMRLPNLDALRRMVMVRDPVRGTSLTWAAGNPQIPVRLMHIPAAGPQNGKSTVLGGLYINRQPPSTANPDAGNPTAPPSAARPPIAPVPHNVTLPSAGVPGSQNVTWQDLPSSTIAGLYVTGERNTRVIPAGTAGNDRNITVTSEIWTSPDLKITVRQITNDPRSGKVTTELTNVTRTDPDPALFQAPEGYTVRDMNLLAAPAH